ncbi:MAG: radical SAM protein [Deltaproteobacteria bacterium]
MIKNRDKDYTFYEAAISLCSLCLKRVDAKVVLKDNSVFLKKYCPQHGEQIELFEEDIEYFLKKRHYDKPGTSCKTQTKAEKGCPFDCGLCPNHDQHTCIGLIEITNKCDLNCRVCYSNAGSGTFLSLTEIEKMMDLYQDSEFNTAEIIQISGGEPAAHPEIIEIIRMAKRKGFKYVMLNTNGIRIANDEDFAAKLREFTGGFEVYLQFDGLVSKAYSYFRGQDLSQIKRKAVENLAKYKVPITLVCMVENEINDNELGEIIEFGIKTKYIRGINFQPVSYSGRTLGEPPQNRITLSGIIKRIESQTNKMIIKDDFVPLPCNVERVAVSYLYKSDKGFIPVTRNSSIKKHISKINNTFFFKVEDVLKETAGEGVCNCLGFLKDFKKLMPKDFNKKSKDERMEYINDNTFRISITSFVDAYNFDLKSMQKECVHIITPDMRKIPFSAYNMLYRNSQLRGSRMDENRANA